MGSFLMLFAEILVAILLVATVVTSVRLSRRIARMQADEAAMRSTVIELMKATETAERAIAGLRSTLGECEKTLADRLRIAERYASDLAEQVEAGESVMNRMMTIVDSSRRIGPERATPQPAPAPAAPPPVERRPAPPEPQAVIQPQPLQPPRQPLVLQAFEQPAPVAAPQPVAAYAPQAVAPAPAPAPVASASLAPAPPARRVSDRISDAAELLAQRAMRRAGPEGSAA